MSISGVVGHQMGRYQRGHICEAFGDFTSDITRQNLQ